MSPEELRALDAYLAEHLLGWERVELNAYTPRGRDACGTPPDGYRFVTFPETGRAFVPHLSTSYEGMGAVLEALADRGWEVEMSGAADIKWLATVSAHSQARFPAADRSLPLAVALAAKAAIEAEGVQS